METIVLTGKSNQKAKLLLKVGKELGFNGRKMSTEEIEDIGLVIAMKKGRTEKYVSKEQILKTLRK